MIVFFFFFQEPRTSEHKQLRKKLASCHKQAAALIKKQGFKIYQKVFSTSFTAYYGIPSSERARSMGVKKSKMYDSMDDSELKANIARLRSLILVLEYGAFPDEDSLLKAVRSASAILPNAVVRDLTSNNTNI